MTMEVLKGLDLICFRKEKWENRREGKKAAKMVMPILQHVIRGNTSGVSIQNSYFL